jgi:hypothetical protein
LIFDEYSILWLEKKKIGESFKVQFGKKSPNNGKNQHHHTLSHIRACPMVALY